MKNWIKCLIALVAMVCVGVFTEDADARHHGSRSVTRTVVRTPRVRTRTVIRGDVGVSHHHSFNSFRGFGDPGFYSYGYGYCPDSEFVEERTVIRRSFR